MLVLNWAQVEGRIVPQTVMQLYKESDMILVGNVTSAEISSLGIHTFYHVKVEQYMKSPQQNDTITAVGSGPNGGHGPPDPKFMVGDRVRLYLYKEDGMYMISMYSNKANPKCYAHELLGLGPREPIPRGGNDQKYSEINCGPPFANLFYPNTVSFLPPTIQFKSGIKPQDIACNNDLQLVIKTEDGTPACVKLTSLERLLKQGWVNPYDKNGKYSYSQEQKTDSSVNRKLKELNGIIIDQSLSVSHVYYFFTNDTSMKFNTGSTGIRLEGIDNIDDLNGKHVKMSGTLVQNGEDKIKVEKFQILGSFIPKGNPSENIIQKVSFDDLFDNPNKYYNQTIAITGQLREHDYPLAFAGVGCYTAEFTTNDKFVPDFISRHQLYDGERYIGVRIGGQNDVGYSETEKLPLDLKNKQVTVTGIFVPGIKDTGDCVHILHKSGYILTNFTKINVIKD